MKIEQTLQAYAAVATQVRSGAHASPSRASSDNSVPVRKTSRDTVEISAEGKRRLSMIQNRIDSGYYHSSAVTDDISDKLSKVLDSLT